MQGYKDEQEEIYSNKVRAGKRTYFFDVRATKANDYYLTITESKKIFDDEGNHSFKKHKIFLYKEDFEKFKEAFIDTVQFINDKKGSTSQAESSTSSSVENDSKSFTDIDFEDI